MHRNFVFIFSILLHAAASIKLWDDLRIRFSRTEAGGFHRVGRTFSSVLKDDNWRVALPLSCVTLTDSGSGMFYGYQVLNKENSVALLHDVKGSIAGMQALEVESISPITPTTEPIPMTSFMNDPEPELYEILYDYPRKDFVTPQNPFRFDAVPMFQNVTLDGVKYLILTAYFVDPETICETGRAEVAMKADGTGEGLWLQNGSSPASSAPIPFNRRVAQLDDWTEQNCFPAMGWHNFYKVDELEAKNCLDFLPVFLLYNSKDEMIGFGFRVFGLPHNDTIFEFPQHATIKKIIREPVPRCLLDLNDAVGTTLLHVYFVDKPWEITCP